MQAGGLFRNKNRSRKPLGFRTLKDHLGQATRENPFTAGTIGIGAAGQIKNIPDIVSGGVGLAS